MATLCSSSMTNHELYLSLGSNLGNKKSLLQQALRLLEERLGKVVRVSDFIETEPWGFVSPNTFLNACCCVHTSLSPRACLEETRRIERELGRTQKSEQGQYHDRTIDIDLLLYDSLRINEPDLVIPHPHMQKRDFVMVPLRQIMPVEGSDLVNVN